jgi:hypothetical protein
MIYLLADQLSLSSTACHDFTRCRLIARVVQLVAVDVIGADRSTVAADWLSPTELELRCAQGLKKKKMKKNILHPKKRQKILI